MEKSNIENKLERMKDKTFSQEEPELYKIIISQDQFKSKQKDINIKKKSIKNKIHLQDNYRKKKKNKRGSLGSPARLIKKKKIANSLRIFKGNNLNKKLRIQKLNSKRRSGVVTSRTLTEVI